MLQKVIIAAVLVLVGMQQGQAASIKQRLGKGGGEVFSVAFHPDGNIVAAAAGNGVQGTVRFWRAHSGEQLVRRPRATGAHES